MDRFIDFAHSITPFLFCDLKSNMDRFIGQVDKEMLKDKGI